MTLLKIRWQQTNEYTSEVEVDVPANWRDGEAGLDPDQAQSYLEMHEHAWKDQADEDRDYEESREVRIREIEVLEDVTCHDTT